MRPPGVVVGRGKLTCESCFYIMHSPCMVLVFRAMEQQGQEQAIHTGQIGLGFGTHNLPERMLMCGSNKRADDVSIERR